MYKAKILKNNKNGSFQITLPSLELKEVLAYEVGVKSLPSTLETGDLVIADKVGDDWVILGYVKGQKDEPVYPKSEVENQLAKLEERVQNLEKGPSPKDGK